MSEFSTKLDVLTSGELSSAKGDPERIGIMLEKLGSALGFTIAMAARGDGAGIDELFEGISNYIHGEAVSKAPMAAALSEALAMSRPHPTTTNPGSAGE